MQEADLNRQESEIYCKRQKFYVKQLADLSLQEREIFSVTQQPDRGYTTVGMIIRFQLSKNNQ